MNTHKIHKIRVFGHTSVVEGKYSKIHIEYSWDLKIWEYTQNTSKYIKNTPKYKR